MHSSLVRSCTHQLNAIVVNSSSIDDNFIAHMSSIIYLLLLLLLLPSVDSWNLPFPSLSLTHKNLPPQTSLKVFAKKALATTTLIPLVLGFASPSFAGFEDYAKTSKMTADPICFITKCKAETTSLTPTSVKGLKCLGQCKGEQTCASQCFNKYTSPELESWLNCALERENCLPLPPSATENAPIKDLPPPMTGVDFKKMEGKWYKSYGKSDIYDMFPCQTNSFNVQIDNNQVSGLKAGENTFLGRAPSELRLSLLRQKTEIIEL